MFYDKFEILCKSNDTNPSRACIDMGLSRSLAAKWKNTGANPSAEVLSKMLDYFGVPIDFLLSRPPFDVWELINRDRLTFLSKCNIDPEVLWLVWEINHLAPYRTSLTEFINFVGQAIVSANINSDGEWSIVVKEDYRRKEKPALTSEDGLSNTACEIMDVVKQLSVERQRVVLAQVKALAQMKE